MQTISRRDFLRRSVAGAVGLGVMGLPQKSSASDTLIVPAVVIGSGFGGAVAALRLAQAGVKTVVLERGRRWPIRNDGNTFATFDKPDGRAAWLSESTVGLDPILPIDRYTGVLELIDANGLSRGLRDRAANGVQVRNGAGVGGGSLAFNAIMLQPRRELFQQVFPRHIDYDEMDEIYYPCVRQMIGQSPIPDDILTTDFYISTRVNLEQAENAGLFEGSLVEFAIDWDVVEQEIDPPGNQEAVGDRRSVVVRLEQWSKAERRQELLGHGESDGTGRSAAAACRG